MIKRTTAGAKFLLVDDLPPEDIGMVQAFYSRSAESAETHINVFYKERREALRAALIAHGGCGRDCDGYNDNMLDSILAETLGRGASAKSRKLFQKWYVNFNHKSIGDGAPTTLFIEGVSMLVAKSIQDNPMYAGQETSTRYIDMSKQRMIDPIDTPASKAVLDRWMAFYLSTEERVLAHVRKQHPQQPGESDAAYEGACKARGFDTRRAFIPAGTTTNLSWAGNLRQAGDKLASLLYHPLAEVRMVGRQLQGLLEEAYPSTAFGRAAAVSGEGAKGTGAEAREAWERQVAETLTYNSPVVNGCHDFQQNAFELSRVLPSGAERDALLSRPRGCVLPHKMTSYGQIHAHFELDFGSARDLQRQRNGVFEMPLLTTALGFEQWYLDQLPDDVRREAELLIAQQIAELNRFDVDSTVLQYYIPFGFKVACQIMYALPAFCYVVELRSGAMIHPTLRKVIHQMIEDFKRLHPELPLHVNMEQDPWDVRRGLQTNVAR